MTDQLHVEYVPASAIRRHPDNARQGDVGAIHESIEANGLYKPLVVQRSTGYVLAGNHTYEALLQRGAEQVPVVYRDVDDEAALRILLADNRTGDRASYDDRALIALLESLPDLSGTGWDGDDLDRLLAGMTPFVPAVGENDPDAEWEGMPAFDSDDKMGVRSMIVHFRTHEDVEAFGQLVGMRFTDKTRSIWYPYEPWDNAQDYSYVRADEETGAEG